VEKRIFSDAFKNHPADILVTTIESKFSFFEVQAEGEKNSGHSWKTINCTVR